MFSKKDGKDSALKSAGSAVSLNSMSDSGMVSVKDKSSLST